MTYPTLEDLKRPNVPVTIQLPNGEGGVTAFEFPLKIPSFFRIQEIIASIPEPTPPLDAQNPYKRLANGDVRPQYDYNAPSYLAERQLRTVERNHALLLEAWDESKLPLPGETREEKLNYLKQDVDPLVVRQLIEILTQYALLGKAEIDYRAASFRSRRSDAAEPANTEGLDVDLVEGTP